MLKNNFAIILVIVSKKAACNTLRELCVKIDSYLSEKGCDPQGQSSMINCLVNGFPFFADCVNSSVT